MEPKDIITIVVVNITYISGLISIIYKMQVKRFEEKFTSVSGKLSKLSDEMDLIKRQCNDTERNTKQQYSDSERILSRCKEESDRKREEFTRELYHYKENIEKNLNESIREERRFWQELIGKNEKALNGIFNKLNESINNQGRFEERLKSVEKLLQDKNQR